MTVCNDSTWLPTRRTVTRVACSFWMRNSQSDYNALKVFKTKPLCGVFLERNELLMNLGQIFYKFLKR